MGGIWSNKICMLANQYSQAELLSYKFIQNMAEPTRDCSKSRPTTFGEIIFSISQQIENKIKNKNIGLRKAAWSRLQERQKSIKPEETKPEISSINFQKGPFNYLELYKPQKKERDSINFCPEPQLCKLDGRDQETALQIYLLIKKRKPIFKVEEVKRKLRAKDSSKRMNHKQCECCGACGRHKCTHILCQKKCAFFGQLVKTEDISAKQQGIQHEEPVQMVAIAQQLINAEELEGTQIKRVQIAVKQQQMVIPQIDVIDDEAIKKELQAQPHGELDEMAQGVVETERISEVQSKSEVSESRRHRSEFKEVQNIELAPNNAQISKEEEIEQQNIEKKEQ